MTAAPRKPLFGFIFTPPPATPGAGQITWLRIPPRGPLHLAVLVGATLALAAVVGTALLATATMQSPEGIAVGAVGLVALVPLVFLVARGWITGTYVNDSGVRVVRMRRSDFVPWSIVTGIDVFPEGGRRHIIVDTTEGSVRTTIGSFTWDTAFREHSWLSSVDRMRVWQRESNA